MGTGPVYAPRRAPEVRPGVATVIATGRVGPVQGRVDRQQVRQVVPGGVHEIVDPLDPHRTVPPATRSSATERGGATAPSCWPRSRRRSPTPSSRAGRREGSAARTASPRSRSSRPVCLPALDGPRARHHRRYEQRCHELRHGRGIQRAARNRCDGPSRAVRCVGVQHEARARDARCPDEAPPAQLPSAHVLRDPHRSHHPARRQLADGVSPLALGDRRGTPCPLPASVAPRRACEPANRQDAGSMHDSTHVGFPVVPARSSHFASQRESPFEAPTVSGAGAGPAVSGGSRPATGPARAGGPSRAPRRRRPSRR